MDFPRRQHIKEMNMCVCVQTYIDTHTYTFPKVAEHFELGISLMTMTKRVKIISTHQQ